MKEHIIYPMKLTPPLKDYIWGGQKLKTQYGKKSELDKVAESWELSCHKDGSSIINGGEYDGISLPDYIKMQGTEILGENCKRFENFPVLIKLIDACDNLSIQVHPNNDYAMRVEGEYGKTEMWYIVDCQEGASLIYGFKDTISKAEFEQRIKDNTLLEVVNQVRVKKGDVFFIEAGTLHGIGAGILIAEIQQNSNTTYRVYDYGRLGVDNKPRQLHIDKALDVTSLTKPSRPIVPQGEAKPFKGGTQTLLSSCEYFKASLVEAIGDVPEYGFKQTVDNTSFQSILCLKGKVNFESKHGNITIEKGESVFLEANFGDYLIYGDHTSGEIIITTV